MNKVKTFGLVETENGYACDQCRGVYFKESMHLDGPDSYETHCICQSCGNAVRIVGEREESWDDGR